MPDKMRGALYNGNQGVVVQDVPLPDRFPGSALIRVRQVGICGSDLNINRDSKTPGDLPEGHEVAGEILDLPSGQHGLNVGDRVAIDSICFGLSCGNCWYCRMGQRRHCQSLVDSTGGGYAEFMTRNPAGLFKMTNSMEWSDGALVEPLAVSVHAIRWGGMKPGDTVAVVGSSTIGLAAIAAARYLGAGLILASARYPAQATAARKMGADYVLDSARGELEGATRDATDGRGADFVIETIGGYTLDTLDQAVDTCRDQGKIVVVGGFRKKEAFDFITPIIRELTLLFSSCYGIVDGRHDYEVAIDMLSVSDCSFRRIVTHVVPLEQIQQGFDTAYDKSTGSLKVQVTS